MFHENKTDGDILRKSTLFNAFNRILKRAKPDKELRKLRLVNRRVRFLTSNIFGHNLVIDQKC